MKKIFLITSILIMFLFVFIIIDSRDYDTKNIEYEEIQVRELVGEKDETQFCLLNKWSGGGGGLMNQNIGEYLGAVGGGGGGLILIGITYFISQQCHNYYNSLIPNNNSSLSYNSNVTIGDVLSDSKVSEAMKKYGWSSEQIIEWLETMLGVTVDKFLNDSDIKVYLGQSDYELKYYEYADVNNHKYAFRATSDVWNNLVDFCSGNYDMIWVLNMVFLQMCIFKNVTFVLVTPTKNYYNYYEQQPEIIDGRYTFYSQELQYINKNGYCWSDFYNPLVETKRI